MKATLLSLSLIEEVRVAWPRALCSRDLCSRHSSCVEASATGSSFVDSKDLKEPKTDSKMEPCLRKPSSCLSMAANGLS